MNRFIDFQERIFRYFKEQNYSKVRQEIQSSSKEFKRYNEKLMFWEACSYALEGKTHEALLALERGLIKGAWWNPDQLLLDPDLKSLHGEERFKQIIKRCEQKRQSWNKNGRYSLKVQGNPEGKIGLFILHPRGGNVEDLIPYWMDEELLTKVYFGFPQSSQVYDVRNYCWDDEDKAKEELKKLYEGFLASFQGDQVLLCGVSQGGRLAIKEALCGNWQKVQGYIAVIPSLKVGESLEILSNLKGDHMKGYIVTGDKDPFFKEQEALKRALDEKLMICGMRVTKDLGHFIPQDFQQILKDAISCITEN